ncbi:hypothetical protein BST63_24505 [Bradyrhizobium canariense]|uniref:DUF3102 domain-containing protein n=1 Tax=Bradyrhizobium canariense TaxID=255045 RepID=A0ABX3WZ46_9BRAD|nr:MULTISPECIES: DUF3102 domain-containing protein [Bradyrhizobium]OSJ17133.1 hypothetical protein BSR47_10745 [Bradyrhizobium canariense]OSJ25070.1 hypothetical protein BST63_24505 [Bradyrhizobium canariense]WOH61671.1 DUF3102 domain-containing protein [Bradyrhizobium sp. BWC-3-1]
MAFDYSDIPPNETQQLRLIAQRVKKLLPTIIPAIIQVGTHLEEAKSMIPHGRFGAYCLEEMGISDKSAQNYMNLAKLARSQDPAELAKLAAGAAYELAAKSTPETVVSEVLSDVRAGRSVSEGEVKERIAKARGRLHARQIDQIAELLIEALDPDRVREIESFLRLAHSVAISALAGRLREALNVNVAPPSRGLN